jgi:hypothetical protein
MRPRLGGVLLAGLAGRVLNISLGAALVAAPIVWAAPASSAPASSKKATKSSSSTGLSSQVAEQKRRIDEQQRLIEEQRALVESQRAMADSQAVVIAAQSARLDSLGTQLVVMRQRLATLESQANFPAWQDSLDARIRMVESATQKSPELPPDVVSAGDFPGSIRVPGSDAAIKFGARIRTAMVFTLDPLGTDDRFLTNSIPVGVPSTGEAKRTNISARASRLNTEFRTPAGSQEVRAFFEGDFDGAGDSFRMRHAYAQYRGFITGQTWSTFSDPWLNLEDLDNEGVSSENVIRQPQLRYWWTRHKTQRLAVAMETPAVSITGGTGVNLFPDVVGRVFVDLAKGGHVQVAGVLRQIRGQATAGGVSTVWGGGGSVSGVIEVPVQRLTDRIIFQLNGGTGIARYINDLESARGMDAVFDTTNGTLHALPAIGWFVAYEHRWKEWQKVQNMNLRSTVLWSLVTVDNFGFQPPDAYKKTNRFAGNLVFSPSGRVDVGIEYIYGVRRNHDDQYADANQIQLVGLFRF